jgi:uncharacterized damage-inducible protein DinB
MDRLTSHRRLFLHSAWANRETWSSLAAAGAPPERAARFFAHVLGTEYLWLSRLQGEPSPLAVWPELDLTQMAAQLEILGGAWLDYLDRLDPGDLDRSVSYVNSQGEAWTGSVEEILTHAVMHSVYHRGQVASELRREGFVPAYTDFIHATRQKLLADGS